MTPATLRMFLEQGRAVVRVGMTGVDGSAPREAGVWMLVAADGTLGTIGGGRLEYLAIDAARAMIGAGEAARTLDIPLGPEIGQCCGGRVRLDLSMMDPAARTHAIEQVDAEIAARPEVYVLGAGHVGRALADQLQHLPFRTIVIDERAAELSQCRAVFERRETALPESDIAAARTGSAYIVATHDHALDFMLTGAALARGDAAYVGLIGSGTKRARFERWLREHDASTTSEALACPIGGRMIRDKRPAIIAALVVAEILVATRRIE